MGETQTLQTRKLTPTVGAEVLEVDRERLVADEQLPAAVLAALEEHGVLLFGGLHLDDEAQAAFCRKLGEVRLWPENPIPEIFEISLKPDNPQAKTLDPRGTINWHMDGVMDDAPPIKATVLTARVVASAGGETEFTSTYAAYDDLSEHEQRRLDGMRVFHSLVAARRDVANPTDEQLAFWRSRTRELPVVWTHRSGRKSLLLSSTMDHVIGVDEDEGRALLDDLLARTIAPERVWRHSWTVGDMLIWDNTGVLHRATPYDTSSPREMHRCTILGTEPVQ
jgi:alpha-ketoglutarate-dependent taurine dioxygenase